MLTGEREACASLWQKLITVAIVSQSLLLVKASVETQEASNGGGDRTYGVIVDCGSSGTRAHLFDWNPKLVYPDLLHDIEPLRDSTGKQVYMKITPGLSTFKNDPDGASEYMRPLIEFIATAIPKESHKSTSVYVMGTAGMRLLDEESQLKIMEDVASDIRSRYDFAEVRTRVISGSTEGMYQWITVNSKLKRFHGVGEDTVGIVEMGGSSVQVTYLLKENLVEPMGKTLARSPGALDAFLNEIVMPELSQKLQRSPYKLISATFLGLGSNSAREAYVDLLLSLRRQYTEWFNQFFRLKKGLKEPFVLKDPCLPLGASQVIERPRKMLNWKESDQTVGFTIEAGEETFKITSVGAGNYAKCRQNLSMLLSRVKEEKLNCDGKLTCSMSLLRTKFVPFESFEFLGLGDIYYTTNEIVDLAGKYQRDELRYRTRQVCATHFNKLQALFPNADRNDDTRVLLECFKATWIETFLTEALLMPSNYGRFSTVGKIRQDLIEWTLGAVLDNSLSITQADLAASS